MRIYFDGIIYSWHKYGGIRKYFDELMAHLPSSAQSTLLVREPHYGLPDNKNVKIEDLPLTKILWPEASYPYLKRLFSPLYGRKIDSYFKSVREGVFHSTYFTTYPSLKIPQVLTVHDMTYERFPEFFQSLGGRRFIQQKKRCIEQAEAVICVSRATKESLREMYDVAEEKLTVIHHGISKIFNLSPERPTREELVRKYDLSRPFFLFVGYRGRYKNFPFFARSFARFNLDKGFDLVLVGGEALAREEHKNLISLEMRGRVKHLLNISEIELKSLYQLCEAFVFPSLDEGFGLPILEGLGCGARVVASDLPVFREIAGDQLSYFDPRDEQSLIDALEQVVDKKISEKEIRTISENISNTYTWDKCAEKTMDLYEKLARKPKL